MQHCWKSHIVTQLCYVLDCGGVGSITEGQVSYSSGTTYLSEATFSCNIGYTLSSVITRTCQANSTWSYENPTCDIVGTSYNPQHGRIQRGTGGRDPPPEKSQKYRGCFSNTGREPLKNQTSIQCWAIIGPPAKGNLNGVLLAGR